MTIFAFAPRRLTLLAMFGSFLSGVALGSLAFPNGWEYGLSAGIVLFGCALIGQKTTRLVCLILVLAFIGYSWAAYHADRLLLSDTFHYSGRVRVESVAFRRPPQQRVVLRLLDGQYAGANIRTYVYDWQHGPGTVLQIALSVSPSQHRSDLGYNLIGSASNVRGASVIATPNQVYSFRQRMQERVGASLPEPYASLAVGLVTGLNDNFDASFKDDLERTGTTHLVAVSGYNLTIVALVLRRLGQRYRRWLGFLLAFLGIALYVVIAGGNPSILRGHALPSFPLLRLELGGRRTDCRW